MTNLRLRVSPEAGLTEVYRAGTGPLELLGFSLLSLAPGESYDLHTADREYALIYLTGIADLAAGGQDYSGLGGRTSVFGGKCTGAYLPPATDCRLVARSRALLALCSAPSSSSGAVQIITPADVQVNRAGNWNWRREVHNVIGANVPQAQRLVVGETFNPPGNWSSYPPHKHEIDDFPEEVCLEEIYYYAFNPAQGFGMQRVYTDDRTLDEAYCVEEGDTVLIPRGYHPVVAAPGYQLYYLWMLAGPTERRLRPKDDPAHAWVKAAGEMAKDMGY
ncbi:MAG TPA: 5-deoxy-glucuronate isomerase [Armatimonadota bacterium]|jgi:5-deoxy-glucuronate isomerase